MFKVNNKDTRISKFNGKVKIKNTVDAFLASLLLTFNSFYFLLQYFYCWTDQLIAGWGCCLLYLLFASIFLLKFNYRNTRKRWKICSKLAVKIPERCRWRSSDIFFVNFEHIYTFFYCFCWWLRACICLLGSYHYHFLIVSEWCIAYANMKNCFFFKYAAMKYTISWIVVSGNVPILLDSFVNIKPLSFIIIFFFS